MLHLCFSGCNNLHPPCREYLGRLRNQTGGRGIRPHCQVTVPHTGGALLVPCGQPAPVPAPAPPLPCSVRLATCCVTTHFQVQKPGYPAGAPAFPFLQSRQQVSRELGGGVLAHTPSCPGQRPCCSLHLQVRAARLRVLPTVAPPLAGQHPPFSLGKLSSSSVGLSRAAAEGELSGLTILP